MLPESVSVTYVPGTDFNLFMRQLREANAPNLDIYKAYKMYAFTRMTRGLVLDFVPKGMGLFHSLYTTRFRGYSLAGLSERMAQYYFRDVLTYISTMFFDMDLETDKVVTMEMLEDLLHKVMFPCTRKFFNLEGQDRDSPALHFAVYSPLDQDGEMEPSVKEHMVCGWCKEKKLKMTMCGSTPMAECFSCALRFPRSIQTKEVAKMPCMVSLMQLLKKFNSNKAYKIKFIRPPETWTNIDHPEIDYDAQESTIEFSVGTKRVQVDLPRPRNHLVKVKRKYSVHIKGMQTTHANPEAQAKSNQIASSRFRAFQRKFQDREESKRNLRAFVEYEFRKRQYINKQAHHYEANRVTHAFAEKTTPQYFGFPVHKMEAQDKAMCEHLLDPTTIANVAMTQEIFLTFMAYLVTSATKYQSDLGDEHPFKCMDIQEMFDTKPAINGAALRMCFDRLNEPKPIDCKCPDIQIESRKRNAQGKRTASVECQECHGKGYYMDQSRSPTRLLKVCVDPEHPRYRVLQTKMDSFLPRLHLPKNLPILLASTSTRVNLDALGGLDNTSKGVYADITAHIERCMRGVPPNIIYQKKQTGPSGPEVRNGHILEVVQSYIRSAEHPAWKELSVQALVPWNDDKFPRYRVNVHSTCVGSQWCVYKNDEHTSNTVYFVLVPPRRDGDVANMYAACWSSKCKGYWRNTCQRDKTSWIITPKDVAIIWPGINQSRMVYAPTMADAALTAQDALYRDDMESMTSSASQIELSFREVLQSKISHRPLVMSYQYFKLPGDKDDVPPVIMDAYRALNLVGS